MACYFTSYDIHWLHVQHTHTDWKRIMGSYASPGLFCKRLMFCSALCKRDLTIYGLWLVATIDYNGANKVKWQKIDFSSYVLCKRAIIVRWRALYIIHTRIHTNTHTRPQEQTYRHKSDLPDKMKSAKETYISTKEPSMLHTYTTVAPTNIQNSAKEP